MVDVVFVDALHFIRHRRDHARFFQRRRLESVRRNHLGDKPHCLRFACVDAQQGPIPDAPYDAAFSRFGVMFFEDPVAAFRQLAGSVVPGGRIVFVCWRGPQDNPWVTVPMGAIRELLTLPAPPPPNSPGMFGFADRDHVAEVLEAAGCGAVEIQPHDIEMTPGGRSASLEEAAEMFVEVGPVAAALRESGADEALRARVRERLAEISTGEAEGLLWFGTSLIDLLLMLVRAVATAFNFSFFFCVSTAIYLLMRRAVDQNSFDDVYLEDEQHHFSLPPVEEAAAEKPPEGE